MELVTGTSHSIRDIWSYRELLGLRRIAQTQKPGLRALMAGALSNLMSATIAGIFLSLK